MSRRAPNPSVGTVACMVKNCSETAEVFKYRASSDDKAKQRFAGRLFCVCPKHGRIENQEYLLEHIQWSDKPAAPAASPAPAPAPASSSPSSAPPASSSPPRPAAPAAVKPAAAPVKPRPSPWLPDYWA